MKKQNKNKHDSKNLIGVYLKEINKQAKQLSAEEIKALTVKWKTQNDQDALDKIICNHLRYAFAFARRYAKQEDDFEDMLGEINLALITSARNYDPEQSNFLHYANIWMKCHAKRFIRDKLNLKGADRVFFSKIYNILTKIKQGATDEEVDALCKEQAKKNPRFKYNKAKILQYHELYLTKRINGNLTNMIDMDPDFVCSKTKTPEEEFLVKENKALFRSIFTEKEYDSNKLLKARIRKIKKISHC